MAGLKPRLDLAADEPVYIPEGDLARRAVADQRQELVQVVWVIAPGAGGGIATAHPVDERLDFG